MLFYFIVKFDEDNFVEKFVAQRNVLCAAIASNNAIFAQCFNEEHNQQAWVGSVPGHIVINRDHENAHQNLFNDCFSPNPRYTDAMFRRHFCMGRDLFLHILNSVCNHDNYFVQKRNAYGKLGLSSLQKITAVFQMLAYGLPADATDEYVKIGESTAVESLKRFCRAVVEVFGEQYLRASNANDIARLLQIGEHRGFPGSNNDINVLESSHLFTNLAIGVAPSANYVIQGKEYNMGYYLADGMYPKWATLVQSIRDPRGPKKQLFATKQEACRKDVERAFGVLKSRFAIVAGPSRFWKKRVLHDIMSASIIMHNMIIEDERDANAPIEEDQGELPTPDVEMVMDENTRFE